MYDFKTKREPFGRGFLNCESDNLTKKTGLRFFMLAQPCYLRNR